MRVSLGKVVLTGTGSAVLMAPVLTAQAVTAPAPAQAPVRNSTNGHSGFAHTPRGKFRVYRKAPGWETSPLGTLYKANYFDGGYAIHGEPAVPLHPASHGCVRVPMGTSKIVAKLLPIGTRVYVRG